ncbi:MAG: class II aldolase/adducin family protein [Anaerolineales bacterium]|nr:class II aldolase/adducin family protein [Anaerolineales bacterium]
MPTEGVIKFQLEHTPADPLPDNLIAEINPWRKWMYERGLIGIVQIPEGMVGYGNISLRVEEGFIISGSQTGHLPDLTAEHYAWATAATPEENRLVSRGPIKPSSESLTHAVVFEQHPPARMVMHAHHKGIWLAAERLELPLTSPDAAYGTVEMAAETTRLFAESNVKEMGIFAMAGHEDGIVTFGESAEQAAAVMEKYLALAGE